MLCTSAGADEGLDISFYISHLPEHLIVLANGILSDPTDWAHFKTQLLEQPGQSFLVYAEKDNVYCKTMGGVDVAGKRLARGVLKVVEQTPSLRRISFVGHSLGGLFVRYALALLYRPGREQRLEREETRSERILRTELNQLPKAVGSYKLDAEGAKLGGSTEADQRGSDTWRPSVCSAHNTDLVEGTPAVVQEADFPSPVSAGLDTSDCRVVDSLAANHIASDPSFEPAKPISWAQPSAQPASSMLDSSSFQPTGPNTPASSEVNLQATKPTPHFTNPTFQPTKPTLQPTKPTSLPTNPTPQPIKPSSQPTKPTSQPTKPNSQTTNPISQPIEPSPQPTKPMSLSTNPTLQPTNPGSQPTNRYSQPTIAGLEPTHLILVAVPNLGVWGRSQWPFARGIHSFERVASIFSGMFLGRTLRQLFLRDWGVTGEPLLLSMTRDCKERPFLSAIEAFQTRHMYANVKWDAALGWKTSSVRLDSEMDRVRKECFGRAEKKQWHGDRYPYIVHVENTPGRGATGETLPRGIAVDYVFAPPLLRQMSEKVVGVLQRKRGGKKKGVESDRITGRLSDDADGTGKDLDRTDNGTERTVERKERTVRKAEQTVDKAHDLVNGTERTDLGTGRTVGRLERTAEGPKWTHSGMERTIDGSEWMEEGTERENDGPDWTPDTRTARAKIRTHRWSSKEECRALADRMVTGLHQVSWRKVDVLFHGANNKEYAHQMLIMKDARQQAAGQGVVNHMIDVLCGRM